MVASHEPPFNTCNQMSEVNHMDIAWIMLKATLAVVAIAIFVAFTLIFAIETVIDLAAEWLQKAGARKLSSNG